VGRRVDVQRAACSQAAAAAAVADAALLGRGNRPTIAKLSISTVSRRDGERLKAVGRQCV